MDTPQSDDAPQSVVEQWVAFSIDDDDEETAINQALDEIEAGKDRPFAEFAEELSARFAARYEQ